MTARWHKLHPHKLLPDYDQSLYVDASILIKDRLSPLFDEVLREASFALFRHPTRDCLYQEAAAVKRLRHDDAAIVDTQMAFYRAHGLPPRAGLHLGGIQFRRHNDAKLIELMEDWWRQLKIFSHRDQLSLGFILRRHRFAVAELPSHFADNPWFMVGPHRRFRVDLEASLPPVDADEIDWLRSSFIGASRRSSPGLRSRLTEARRSMLCLVKMPRALGKRIIVRRAWRKYVSHVRPGAR